MRRCDSVLHAMDCRWMGCGAGLLGLLGLLLSGCGGADAGRKIVPVSGRVTIDGKEIAGIGVTFQPIAKGGETNPGPSSSDITDADGRFTLKTIGGQAKSGAVVGKHGVKFVTMSQADSSDDTIRKPANELVPPKYRDQPAEFEVPDGGTDKADFALTSQ